MTDISAQLKRDRDVHDPNRVDCGVIIVTYNSADDLGPLLASLPEATAGLRIRTVIVDNASSDGTWDRDPGARRRLRDSCQEVTWAMQGLSTSPVSTWVYATPCSF